MEKYFVVASFVCHDGCEDEIHNSQWKVGIFNTVDECMAAGLKDLTQVAQDHYECVFDEEEFDSEEEYLDAIAENVENYVGEHWEAPPDCIEIDLRAQDCAVFLTVDFIDSEFTDQRQVVNYCMYKM